MLNSLKRISMITKLAKYTVPHLAKRGHRSLTSSLHPILLQSTTKTSLLLPRRIIHPQVNKKKKKMNTTMKMTKNPVEAMRKGMQTAITRVFR
jgi:hypothetical protein